jgi:hypothetical protein
MIIKLADAIYSSGETFEFVFPEILADGKGEDGRVVFPNSQYEAILAPCDIPFFDESISELDRLASEGGTVLRDVSDEIARIIEVAGPSWRDRIEIGHDGAPGDIRVYRFNYPDGELFALHNVTDEPRKAEVSSARGLAEWDPTSGSVKLVSGMVHLPMLPHSTRYMTLSDLSVTGEKDADEPQSSPVMGEWTVSTEKPNMVRFSSVEFMHEELGWLSAVDSTVVRGARKGPFTGLPIEFSGRTRIEMRGAFDCTSVPDSLGMVFERAHLDALSVNGVTVDLSTARKLPIWDTSCHWVEISDLVREGVNQVSGTLVYQEFETGIVNQAFFGTQPLPSCDMCLAGSFVLQNGAISRDERVGHCLPIDLGGAGWAEYDGILDLTCRIDVDAEHAEKICGLSIDLVSEDCLEMLLDGKSCGRRIMRPYDFAIETMSPGEHELKLRITGTTANILGDPSPWGITKVNWLCTRR